MTFFILKFLRYLCTFVILSNLLKKASKGEKETNLIVGFIEKQKLIYEIGRRNTKRWGKVLHLHRRNQNLKELTKRIETLFCCKYISTIGRANPLASRFHRLFLGKLIT